MADVLLVDNYDSFVFNLAQAFGTLGARVEVVRHDAITPIAVRRSGATHLVLSPGPRAPADAGACLELIRDLHGELPILGVCLGHQCIGAAFGGRIIRVPPVHGRATPIRHDGSGIFAGLPDPVPMARYHSLAVADAGLPARLRVIARSDDTEGTIMALAATDAPTLGVQFHPESYLSPCGPRLLAAFLALATTRRAVVA